MLRKADRIRLRQILDNLLSNAIKFIPAGGRIELAFVRGSDHAAITVQDSGVGFDEQFADKLFDPFTQQDRTLDRAGGGLGLGFAIASRLAALQGGSLSAASAGIDKGALFAAALNPLCVRCAWLPCRATVRPRTMRRRRALASNAIGEDQAGASS